MVNCHHPGVAKGAETTRLGPTNPETLKPVFPRRLEMDRRDTGLARSGPEAPAELFDHDAGEPEINPRAGNLGRENGSKMCSKVFRREANALTTALASGPVRPL